MKSTVTLNIGLENNSMSDTPNLWFQIYRMIDVHCAIEGKDISEVRIRQTVSIYEGKPERTLIVRFNISSITTDFAENLARRFADAMTQECISWQMRSRYIDHTPSGLTYQTGWDGEKYDFDEQFFEVYDNKIEG